MTADTLRPTSASLRPALADVATRTRAAPDAGAGAAARFRATVESMGGMLETADGADLRVSFTSPMVAIFRPNPGDALLFRTVYAQRYLDRIERVTADAGFPKAGACAASPHSRSDSVDGGPNAR